LGSSQHPGQTPSQLDSQPWLAEARILSSAREAAGIKTIDQ
jgi:hypothetical protein